MQSLCKPFLVLLFAVGGVSVAQTNNAFHVPILQARLPQAAQSAQPQASTTAPLTLTFQDALTRAKANAIDFLQARTEAGIAREDRVQARAALLPSVNFNNEAIYTQPRNNDVGFVFVANNSVHEYVSQANVHEELGFGNAFEYRRTQAAEALARARYEVAARGLVVTVAENYYGLVVAQRKFGTAEMALREAQRFFTISQQLERGGETAHSDVVKAQLQVNDRNRLLQEANLALQKARLALAVLLFPDFNQNFTVIDDLALAQPLPAIEDVRTAATRNNPVLNAASASLQAAKGALTGARGGYLPTVSFDYWYGIDAPQFATYGADHVRNLGYAAAATLNIPIWNWGATQSRIRQAQFRQQQARVELSATQRQLLANIQSFYNEAQTARAERDLLRQNFDLASESLRLTTLKYQGGEATVLEVVDAQNTLTEARDAFDEGEARYKIALANLQTVTGSF
jgi:outer membrane protein TolC